MFHITSVMFSNNKEQFREKAECSCYFERRTIYIKTGFLLCRSYSLPLWQKKYAFPIHPFTSFTSFTRLLFLSTLFSFHRLVSFCRLLFILLMIMMSEHPMIQMKIELRSYLTEKRFLSKNQKS